MKLRLAIAVVLGLTLPLVAQEVRRDGNWEVKVEMSMPNMPTMNMPPMTMNQCITKEEAADPQKMVPPSGRGNAPSDCKMSDYKVAGNKVTFTVTCPSQNSSMSGEFLYGADKYDGTMKMDMARGGQTMTMNMKYSGKRLGDCVKK